MNNPSFDSGDHLQLTCRDTIYRIYKHEKGEETGTHHLQGFTIFRVRKRFSTVKRLYGDRYHLEQCRGTVQSNVDYVKKQDTTFGEDPGPFEWGSLTEAISRCGENKQGKRTDLSDAAYNVRNGDYHNIPDQVLVKYGTHLMRFRAAFCFEDRTEKPTVFWFWGPTGTGKSRTAMEQFDGPKYWKPAGKWWDNYSQQEIIVMDDLRAEDYPYQYLLRVLDRYPLQVEFKGGYCPLNSSIIIITAPSTPDRVYKDTLEDIRQLERRINHCLEFR